MLSLMYVLVFFVLFYITALFLVNVIIKNNNNIKKHLNNVGVKDGC